MKLRKKIIKTSDAEITGIQDADGLTVFKNVPYANCHRFQRPVLKTLSGTVDATCYGPAPWQAPPAPFFSARSGEPLCVPMDEDCLNLIIWTADLHRPKKAILFWIYGGAYIAGYNYRTGFTPEGFVRQHPEVMVIAPNYRVGVFGNLNLSALTEQEMYRFSCNLSIWDIICALQWTHKYAELFGGDVQNITVYGHSAGSNAISHMVVMPECTGLFRRAICQSSFMPDLGTTRWESSLDVANHFFQLLNASSLETLLVRTPQELLTAQKKLFSKQYAGRAFKLFSPVEDGILIRRNAFDSFRNGQINVREMMIGFSEGECDQMYMNLTDADAEKQLIARNADKGLTSRDIITYNTMHPERSFRENLCTIHNELQIMLGGELIAQSACKHCKIFEYMFCVPHPDLGLRALHGDPTYYVFGNHMVDEVAAPGLSQEMMDVFASFLYTGDPGKGCKAKWPDYSFDGTVMTITPQWKNVSSYWMQDFQYWKNRIQP